LREQVVKANAKCASIKWDVEKLRAIMAVDHGSRPLLRYLGSKLLNPKRQDVLMLARAGAKDKHAQVRECVRADTCVRACWGGVGWGGAGYPSSPGSLHIQDHGHITKCVAFYTAQTHHPLLDPISRSSPSPLLPPPRRLAFRESCSRTFQRSPQSTTLGRPSGP